MVEFESNLNPMSSAMNKTLQDQAYAHLKERIVNLDLRPGQELRTAELASGIGLSRTPVREALSRLEQEGLVQRLSGWGYAVRSLDLAEILGLFKLREALEVMAVEEAIASLNDTTLRAMENLLNSSDRYLASGKLAQFRSTTREFHMKIAEAAGNALLTQMLHMINDRVRLVAAMQLTKRADRASEILHENRLILGALTRRDLNAAREAVLAHIRNAKTQMLGVPETTARSMGSSAVPHGAVPADVD